MGGARGGTAAGPPVEKKFLKILGQSCNIDWHC